MPFNGSGVFSRVYSWITDAANGIDVDATRTDTDSNDIASGLSNCICKDGQSTPTNNLPMGGFKLINLATGTADSDSGRVDNANDLSICNFRLTLTSVTPVTTSDVTAATTIYMTPYKGNKVALYDGTNWHVRTSAEMSIAVPATTSTMYDLFCYDNAGTATLELLAWTNDTTRATALVLQNGVLCKTGALTRRYVGSFRTTGVSGQTEDSFANRFVWNYYNRVPRTMRRFETTASWNYSTTGVARQANGSTSNQLNFIVGWSEDEVTANLTATVKSTLAGDVVSAWIGLDSTTAVPTGTSYSAPYIPVNAYVIGLVCVYRGFPGVGKHFLSWIEDPAVVTGTVTWFGNSQGANGIHGVILG